MPVERRERVIAIWLGSTGNGRNPMFNGRRQPSCGGTSRMMREYHVRFCERLGVKFPGPTRQNPNPYSTPTFPLPPAADMPATLAWVVECQEETSRTPSAHTGNRGNFIRELPA